MEQKIYTSTSFQVSSTIHEVEKALAEPVDQATFGRLFIKLEKAQKHCHDQKLLDKIIHLYGQVIDCYVNTKVLEIVSLSSKSPCNLAEIKQEICDVKQYGLSQENLSIIQKIEERIFHKKSIEVPISGDIEFMDEIFGLAGHIYRKEYKQAKSKYRSLPPSVQTYIDSHLCKRNTIPFHNDRLMLQALFAAAHQLANKPLKRYPSPKEIEKFFLDEYAVVQADFPADWLRYLTN